MPRSDSLAATAHFRQKASKWKNIALLLAIFSIMLAVKCLFGSKLSGNVADVGDYIADIKISGIIFEDDFRSEILKKVSEENAVKAVIVRIDSPGGGIVGSEILYNDLRKIAEKKPLVVVMESVAASGGYMAALASDYIVAYNGTLTGSIGVLLESPEVTDLANKIGIKFNTYKSSPLKGSPSPFEKSNATVDKVVAESIDDSYEFFKNLVLSRRGEKLKDGKKSIALDGRAFTGRQALQVGLIDSVGGKDDAIAHLIENKINPSLPIREIEITKNDSKIFEKIFGILPSFLNSKVMSTDNRIMAVMP